MKKILFLSFSITLLFACAQTKEVKYIEKSSSINNNYWQQHIDYTMDIDKVENPAGDRVKITMEGKFLAYKAW